MAVELEGRDQRQPGVEEGIFRIGLLIEGGFVDRRAVGGDGVERPVDEVDAVLAIEVGGADVAARLAAVGVVADERIVDELVLDPGRNNGVQRIDQLLQGQVGSRRPWNQCRRTAPSLS